MADSGDQLPATNVTSPTHAGSSTLPSDAIHSPSRARLAYVPPLDFKAILIWLGVSAALIILFVAMKPSPTKPITAAEMWGIAVMGPLGGWMLTCAIMIATFAIRRTLWRLEPGEWLVLLYAWITIAFLMLVFSDLHRTAFKSHKLELICIVLCEVPLVAAIIANRRSAWWCAALSTIAAPIPWLFIVFAIDRFSSSRAAIPEHLDTPFYVIPPLALCLIVASVINDFRRGESRHWIHWSGVVLAILILAGFVIAMAAKRLLT